MSQKLRKQKRIKKCVWAVDAFEEKSKKHGEFNQFLKAWVHQMGVSLEPVYVLNSEGLNFPSETFSPMIKQFQPAAEKSLLQYLKGFKIPKLLKAKVLVQDQPSITSSVGSLLKYSERARAGLILVNTHARHGLPRLILGSFTESLLLNSRCPVLVMGPHIHAYPLGKILFPTDFSSGSFKVYQKVLEVARQMDSKVILFHRETQPMQPVVQSGVFLLGGGWVPFPEYMSRAEEEKRRLAERWEKMGQDAKVKVESYFESSTTEGVAESILHYAKRNRIAMIAMAAQSGVLASAFLGSITRKVVRAAEAGVLVMHV